MILKNKFFIGEKVWYMSYEKPVNDIIKSIIISNDKLKYVFDRGYAILENNLSRNETEAKENYRQEQIKNWEERKKFAEEQINELKRR